MSITKNTKRIRMFGGNDLHIKRASGWTSLGHVITGTIEDKTDSQEVTFADGNTLDLDGKRKVKLSITLAQTSKEELELIDTLRSGTYPVYYYNGMVESKHQAFYFPEVNVIPNMTLKSPDNPMNIVLEMSVMPQSSTASLNANSAFSFPAGTAMSSYTGNYVGQNNFYIIIDANAGAPGS